MSTTAALLASLLGLGCAPEDAAPEGAKDCASLPLYDGDVHVDTVDELMVYARFWRGASGSVTLSGIQDLTSLDGVCIQDTPWVEFLGLTELEVLPTRFFGPGNERVYVHDMPLLRTIDGPAAIASEVVSLERLPALETLTLAAADSLRSLSVRELDSLTGFRLQGAEHLEGLNLTELPVLTHAALDELATIDHLALQSSALVDLEAEHLQQVLALDLTQLPMTTLSLPALTRAGDISAWDLPSLTAIELPWLAEVDLFSLTALPVLTEVFAPMVTGQFAVRIGDTGLTELPLAHGREELLDLLLYGDLSPSLVHQAFQDLRQLDTFLSVSATSGFTDLTGLEGLAQCGGLSIRGNEDLQDLRGLEGLRGIEGDLRISDNAVLSDLSSLSHLVLVSGDVEIFGNPGITDAQARAWVAGLGDGVVQGRIEIADNGP